MGLLEDQSPEVKKTRVAIDACIQQVQALEGSRAVSLSITKLEEAKMWLGKRLAELGSELPKEYQDKAE